MKREELIEKMLDGYHGAGIKAAETFAPWAEDYKKRMAAALDVAVGELLREPDDAERLSAWLVTAEGWKDSWKTASCRLFRSRFSRYLPKIDPAVEAAGRTMLAEMDGFACKDGQVISDVAKKIVAAVRAADKSLV